MTAKGIKPAADPLETIGGRYIVKRELGRGGMATVYLCTDMRTALPVAVKVLRPELGSAVVVERFAREIEFASRLAHPRIPRVLDSGVVGDLPYYVMTYVEGESLRALLDRVKQMPIEDAIRITQQVIEPMALAHSMGIIHRDIKPGNILIGNDGVFVLDFGIARAILASADETLTSTGIAVGTPAYMSPEQALSDKDIDTRSDIYSLACVTYEMIAGMPPFVGATPQVVMARRFVATPPPLRESRDTVPPAVEAAVTKALARTPADRWQTVEEFGRALSASPSQVALRASIDGRHRRIYRSLLLALLVIMVAGGAWSWRNAHRANVQSAVRLANAWDFAAAEEILQNVTSADPEDPVAQLWLAQVHMLKGSPPADWQPSLLAAADHRADLSAADRERLDALNSYAARKYPDACRHFDTLRKTPASESKTDFTSTLAFADCLRDNQTVVPDAASPSGYRFIASYQLADSLYENLLGRNRSTDLAYAALIPRLQKVLSVDSRLLRKGLLADRPEVILYSQPALAGDTLMYVPYLSPSNGAIMRLANTSLLNAAIARNQERLRSFVTQWTRIAPDNPAGHELLGTFLEASGDLDGPSPSALFELERARQLAGSDDTESGFARRASLANSEIRVFVRLGSYEKAGMLADSVLSWRIPPKLSDEERENTINIFWRLSALRGRVRKVNEIEQKYVLDWQVQLPTGVENPPAVIARDAISLGNFAAFGVAPDSIVGITRRLLAEIPALTAPGKVEAMKSAILTKTLSLAMPVIEPAQFPVLEPTAHPVARAYQAYARGDRKSAKRYIDSLTELHADKAPGEITMDVTFEEAWLTATLGDTARAARLLDNALGGISKAPQSMLQSPLLIASLVRAMALRADLAEPMKERDVAEKWRAAVVQLWGKGDPEVLASMKWRSP